MLSVVVPTISGREESLARTIAAYRDTLSKKHHELIIIKNESSWPRACNVGYAQSKGDVIHFTADDLEPLRGWHGEVLGWLEKHDELPNAKVYDAGPEGTRRFSNACDGANLEIVPEPWFTRVPIMRRDQWERIGAWPEDLTYYADTWVSERGRFLGMQTRMFYSYAFFHHWSQIGRVDSKENMDASGEALKRHRKAMV